MIFAHRSMHAMMATGRFGVRKGVVVVFSRWIGQVGKTHMTLQNLSSVSLVGETVIARVKVGCGKN